MRRLALHLFTLWSAVSLLLFMFVCVLWLRSRAHIDVARYAGAVDARSSQWRVQFYSGEGVICISRVLRERTIGPPEDLLGGGLASYPTGRRSSPPFSGFEPGVPRPLGFGLARSVTVDPPAGRWEQRWTHAALSAPHWSLAIALLLSPFHRTRTWLATRRRRRAGRCQACGYDVRASPLRCPECGTSGSGGSADVDAARITSSR